MVDVDVKLIVWGSDEDGFWKSTHCTKLSQVEDVLSEYSTFEDYDVEYE